MSSDRAPLKGGGKSPPPPQKGFLKNLLKVFTSAADGCIVTNMNTNTTHQANLAQRPEEVPTMSTPTNIRVTVSAANGADAERKVGKYVGKVEGFGLVVDSAVVRSAKHGLWYVLVSDHGGDRNDLWVVLTSYGISPAPMGATWESIEGLGR